MADYSGRRVGGASWERRAGRLSPMAHSSLLRHALTEFANRPLLVLPDESNIDARGRWEPTRGTVPPQKVAQPARVWAHR